MAIGFLAKIVFGVALVIAFAAASLEWAAGRSRILAMTLAILGGVVVAYPFGPSTTPGVGVAGSYSMTFELPAGAAPVSGSLVCDWAPGRQRVARLASPPTRFAGSDAELLLSLDFYGVRASLDTPPTEETPAKAVFLTFGVDSLQPAGVGAPARTTDDASGAARLDLIRYTTDESGPEELIATIRWECQPAPAT